MRNQHSSVRGSRATLGKAAILILFPFILLACELPEDPTPTSPWDVPIGDSRFSGTFTMIHICGSTTIKFDGSRHALMRYYQKSNGNIWYSDRYLTVRDGILNSDSTISAQCGTYIEYFAEFSWCSYEFTEDNTVLRIESPPGTGEYWEFSKVSDFY